MSSVTFEEVRSFAVEQLWPLRSPVSERTALAHDFGVAGLDGKEFMESFSSRFDVDISTFDWIQYFGPEAGGNPLGLFSYLYKRFILGIPARELVPLPELTLGHLSLCANFGRWLPPA